MQRLKTKKCKCAKSEPSLFKSFLLVHCVFGITLNYCLGVFKLIMLSYMLIRSSMQTPSQLRLLFFLIGKQVWKVVFLALGMDFWSLLLTVQSLVEGD